MILASVSLHAQNAPQWGEGALPSDADWVQLASGEWLPGRFLGMYNLELEFDSKEFDIQTWEWYKIRGLRTAAVMDVALTSGDVATGKVLLDGEKLLVVGDKTVELKRSQIYVITRAGESRRHLRQWGGKFDLGMTVLSGNSDQVDLNVSGYVKRRGVANRITVDYFSNYSNVDNVTNANNKRVKGNWDYFVTNKFFWKPLALEVYSDKFQNIDSRTTAGAGAGYLLLVTRSTEWEVAGGLAYQKTRFSNVETGENRGPQTGAFSGSTKYEQRFSKAKVTYEYTFNIVNETSGRYNHHMYTLIETGWTRLLDLDVTLVWDRTQKPQPGADGVVPKPDDYRTVISVGIKF